MITPFTVCGIPTISNSYYSHYTLMYMEKARRKSVFWLGRIAKD